MAVPREELHEFGLLEELAQDPDTTQSTLATRLGVAVGTVNWYLKRLVAKGYIKVKRAERRKLRYILTPEGLALRAQLTLSYVENSMALYRRVREQSRSALVEAQSRGARAVYILGDGDLADVCRLTCLELGLPVVADGSRPEVAVLEVRGQKVTLRKETGPAAPAQAPPKAARSREIDSSKEGSRKR
jgi:DNA-binding MarR family transcriptional regulator